MSRILRRPMFRGGSIDSEGTGITSGLNDKRKEYADGTTDIGVQPSFLENIYYTLNPTTSEILKKLQERQKEEPLMTRLNRFLTQPISASELTYRTEAEKQAAIEKENEAKIAAEKLTSKETKEQPPLLKEDQVSKKQDFKTIYEDLLPVFKAALGPNEDDYTKQKYLELAKFGLNLLKPNAPGTSPSLLSNVASAAERPLEAYGSIIERERQAAKVPETLALQQAVKLAEPGTVGKSIRDLINSGAAKNEKEAIQIIMKGDSAAQKKEARAEKEAIASRLTGYEALKGVKDQATIDQLSELIYKDPNLINKLKGDVSKFKTFEEGAIYLDKGKIRKYKKGLLYAPGEPGFEG